MSSVDPIAALFAGLDEPVAPRPEFADALRSRLLLELRAPGGGAAKAQHSRWGWLRSSTPRHRRVLILVAILLLLLAGVATATYFGTSPWTASQPRGAQVTDDFLLTKVFRAPRSMWMDSFNSQALSADGHDLYLVRGDNEAGRTVLLRIRGIDTPHPSPPRQILDFREMLEPFFFYGPSWDGLAVAPGGDLFMVAGSDSRGPLDLKVAVLHPDGTHQVVVTYAELKKAGVLPSGFSGLASFGGFSIAATAADRLWLRAAIEVRRIASGWPYDLANVLVEIVDPNADGDWSDRVVQKVAVPRSVPAFQGPVRSGWMYITRLVAEPAAPGQGDSRSVLLQGNALLGYGTANPRPEYRIYRISDLNDDGDALDASETKLLYRSTHSGWYSGLAERIGPNGRRELVLGGRERSDRLTIVPEGDRPVDIGRSFPTYGGFMNIFTSPNGDIYPLYFLDQATEGEQLQVDRLSAGDGTGARTSERQPPPITPPTTRGPLLLLTRATSWGASATTTWVRPGGSVVARARHVSDVCQAPDGSVTFRSDVAVPRESYVYMASRGGVSRKATERELVPVCTPNRGTILLSRRFDLPDGPAWSLEQLDRRTKRLRTVVGYTPRYEVSPDGTALAFVARGQHRDSLVVLDLATLKRKVVLGPTRDASIAPSTSFSGMHSGTAADDLEWSPDGGTLAVVTGRGFDSVEQSWADPRKPVRPRTYVVTLVDVASGVSRRLTRVEGGPPTLTWSGDGRQLLVCAAVRGPDTGCGNHDAGGQSGWPGVPSVVRLVDIRSGRSRVVARGTIVFAAWNTMRRTFTWADDVSLHFLGQPRRTTRLFSLGGNWLGWSPGGRYVVQGPKDGYRVVDLVTGKRHAMAPWSTGSYGIQAIRWWR